MRNPIFRAASLSVSLITIMTVVGGCQPKNADTPTTRPVSREPVRRVEVISRSSPELANSLVNRKCRVQIRRDALGMAGNAPSGMEGRWAAESSVNGTIVEMTDQWLVVQTANKRVVVPNGSILLIELQD